MTQITEIKTNYKKLKEIEDEVRKGDLEEYLKFDNNGRFKFYHCESCAGPVLGHLAAKCRGLNRQRYNEWTSKSFEDWLERTAEFRKAYAEREKERKKIQDEEQAKVFKRILESIPPSQPQQLPQNTTQLVKSRWPPSWIGQKFEKWRLEVD